MERTRERPGRVSPVRYPFTGFNLVRALHGVLQSLIHAATQTQEIYLYRCLVSAEVISGHTSTQVSGNNGTGNKRHDLLALRPVYTKKDNCKSN